MNGIIHKLVSIDSKNSEDYMVTLNLLNDIHSTHRIHLDKHSYYILLKIFALAEKYIDLAMTEPEKKNKFDLSAQHFILMIIKYLKNNQIDDFDLMVKFEKKYIAISEIII